MLNEAIQEKPTIGQLHLLQRQRLTDRHTELLEEIQQENLHKSKYWILGTAKGKRKNGRTTIRPFLKAYDTQPEVKKECYLYEIDNIAGTRTLLWVMHPNGKLAMPVINKSIQVTADSGVEHVAGVTGV